MGGGKGRGRGRHPHPLSAHALGVWIASVVKVGAKEELVRGIQRKGKHKGVAAWPGDHRTGKVRDGKSLVISLAADTTSGGCHRQGSHVQGLGRCLARSLRTRLPLRAAPLPSLSRGASQRLVGGHRGES